MLLLVLHLGVATVKRFILPSSIASALDVTEILRQLNDEPGLENQRLIVVNEPSPLLGYFPYIQAFQGDPLPLGMRVLSPGFAPLDVTRTGESTLHIESQSENLFTIVERPSNPAVSSVYMNMRICDAFLPTGFQPQEGEQLRLGYDVVRITKTGKDGLPKGVEITFPVPLRDSSLRVVILGLGGQFLRPVRPLTGGGRYRAHPRPLLRARRLRVQQKIASFREP